MELVLQLPSAMRLLVALLVLVFQFETFAAKRPVGKKVSKVSGFARYAKALPSYKCQLDQLPKKGAVRNVPWNGYFWPLAKGGMNARTAGKKLAPTEKFEKAFGRELSRMKGYKFGALHEMAWKDIPVSKRTGKRTIKDWEGYCHGSTLAATLMAEPQKPVTVNGVEFSPSEIKGLASWITAIGMRSYKGQEQALKYHFIGRRKKDPAADITPAAFHLAVANSVGRNDRHVIMDIDQDKKVFHYPVVSYNEGERGEVDVKAYNQKNSTKAKRVIRVKMDLVLAEHHKYNNSKRTKKSYTYTLELDDNNCPTGGQWLNGGQKPDFIWMPEEDTIRNYDRRLTEYKPKRGVNLWPLFSRFLLQPSVAGEKVEESGLR